LHVSFFWRTLLLLVLLLGLSLAAAFQSFRTYDLEPRARQIGQQVAAIVNLTRTAMVYTDPIARRGLWAELQQNERIQVYKSDAKDVVQPLAADVFNRLFGNYVMQALGEQTRIASSVNGQDGVWVSFTIENDRYWLRVERDRLERNPGVTWVVWAAGALLLALAGAVAISSVITSPLRNLADAVAAVARGQPPPKLTEQASPEIALVNQSFNQMVTALNKVDEERRLMLAGISHDLRTPITRMRLELEMSELPQVTRAGIEQDLSQMDAIVGQFIDMARPQAAKSDLIDLNAITDRAVVRYKTDARGMVRLNRSTTPHTIKGDRNALERALTNLIENGLRYGHARGARAEVTVTLGSMKDESGRVLHKLIVSDNGPGITPDQLPGLLRPFKRGETSRTDATGAGLGLAIVDRIIQQHGGTLQLASTPGKGFSATMHLPAMQPQAV
jgi:two-component system, OmpR family, osmolarity sensor histidine kinase EnvZ